VFRDYDFSSIYNLEGKTVTENNPDYKMIVLTRRLKTPGVLETMSEQVPEVMEAFAEIHTKLIQSRILTTSTMGFLLFLT